jgi:carbon storage regulator CsrA
MLVLSRKVGQEVMVTIGDTTLVVRVLAQTQGKVRLGFTAPPGKVRVCRGEVYGVPAPATRPPKEVGNGKVP